MTPDISPKRGNCLIRLLRDRRGIGAVEFALLAPILLMLYIGTFELTVGLSVAKRATRAAGTVADLVTQQKSVNKKFLATMSDVTEAIFTPYSTTNLSLKITGVALDSTGAPKVAWSWQKGGTAPYLVNAAVPVPTDLRQPNTFLVRTELSVDHRLMMFAANSLSMDTTSITLKREYFFRQRLDNPINCTDCGT